MLSRMPQHSEEAASVVGRYEGNPEIPNRTAHGNQRKKPPLRIVRCAGRCEEQARRSRQRNQRRSNQTARPPSMEELQELPDRILLELAIEIGRSSLSC